MKQRYPLISDQFSTILHDLAAGGGGVGTNNELVNPHTID